MLCSCIQMTGWKACPHEANSVRWGRLSSPSSFLSLAPGDRLFRLARAVCAAAQGAQLRHGVDGFVAVAPVQKNGRLAQPHQLMQPAAVLAQRSPGIAVAFQTGTMAAEVVERKDAFMAVIPMHPDGVAADLVETLDLERVQLRRHLESLPLD